MIAHNILKRNSNIPVVPHQEDFEQLKPMGLDTVIKEKNNGDNLSKWLRRETYAATLEPIETAWGLPPEVYTDPDYTKVEKEKVFKQSWIAIDLLSGHLKEHGDALSTKIGESPIIITNNNGELKGFLNICRHRGMILLKEGKYTKCNIIRCPYHSWTYGCNGKLAGNAYFNDDKMPNNKEQRSNPDLKNEIFEFHKIQFNKEEYGLFEIGVKEFFGTIYVNLDTDKERREKLFKYQFGDLYDNYGHYPWDDMRIVKQIDFDIKANWKLVVENFTDYYHTLSIHPELFELSSTANHITRQGVGQYGGLATYPLSYGGTSADPDAFTPFDGLNHVDLEAAWYMHVFPNIEYFIFPHHVIVLIVQPTDDPAVCTEKMTLLMHKSVKEQIGDDEGISIHGDKSLNTKVKKLLSFWGLVNEQDIEALETVQKGMQGNIDRFRGGRISGKFEKQSYRFQHILVDYMTDNHMREYPGDPKFVKSEFLKPKPV